MKSKSSVPSYYSVPTFLLIFLIGSLFIIGTGGSNGGGSNPTWYYDSDGDGYGNPLETIKSKTQPIGYVEDNTDCDDSDADEHPGQIWHVDEDGDGYTSGVTIESCLRSGSTYCVLAELNGIAADCDDSDDTIYPRATEIATVWHTGVTEVVLEPGTDTWENVGVGHPHVMYENDIYKMWYWGKGPDTPSSDSFGLGYVTSTDGVNWENRQIIFGPEDKYHLVSGPFVIKDGDIYKMWFNRSYEWVRSEWSSYIGYMTSTDGINWSSHQKVFSAAGEDGANGNGFQPVTPSVIKESDQYTMWFAIYDYHSWDSRHIMRSTSSNGTTWTAPDLVIPYSSAEDQSHNPEVIIDGNDNYLMYYYNNLSYLCSVTSQDGITWSEEKTLGVRGSTPSFVEGPDGTPYLYMAYGGIIFRMSGHYESGVTCN
jgi:hypothetical protein